MRTLKYSKFGINCTELKYTHTFQGGNELTWLSCRWLNCDIMLLFVKNFNIIMFLYKATFFLNKIIKLNWEVRTLKYGRFGICSTELKCTQTFQVVNEVVDFHADGESFGISLDYASYLKFFGCKIISAWRSGGVVFWCITTITFIESDFFWGVFYCDEHHEAKK